VCCSSTLTVRTWYRKGNQRLVSSSMTKINWFKGFETILFYFAMVFDRRVRHSVDWCIGGIHRWVAPVPPVVGHRRLCCLHIWCSRLDLERHSSSVQLSAYGRSRRSPARPLSVLPSAGFQHHLQLILNVCVWNLFVLGYSVLVGCRMLGDVHCEVRSISPC
jgi:hypothetical protein